MINIILNIKSSYENLKKTRRMRILGARIFSKSFGGKIEILTAVTMKTLRIFLLASEYKCSENNLECKNFQIKQKLL